MDDVATWYILEGKLIENNNSSSPSTANGSSSANSSNVSLPSAQYYHLPALFGVPSKFIDILVSIFADLIPAIKNLITLASKPQQFFPDILKAKLGENFEMFSPQLISKFQMLSTMDPLKVKDFINNNQDLKEYVYSTEIGAYRHILDGQAIITFLGIRFGLELKKLKINLIFQQLTQLGGGGFNFDCSNPNIQNPTNNGGGNGTPQTSASSVQSLPDSGGIPTTQNVSVNGTTVQESIVYSTGVYEAGVNYEYIYINQTVLNILNDYTNALNSGDLDTALSKLIEAKSLDPNNDYINKQMQSLLGKVSSSTQPLLDFLLNLVTMPINVVLHIVKYIMCFFESINIGNLIQKITDFVTFKWILDFFKPDFLLGLLGLKFDLDKLHDWKANWKTYPQTQMFDLSELFSVPFFLKLPTVPRDMLQYMLGQLCEIINTVLRLIEGIVNSIIDFIWALITLDAIIPQPYIHLAKPCSKNSQGLSVQQIFDLLNGITPVGATPSAPFYDQPNAIDAFVYDIKTSTGQDLRELNMQQLQQFIDENPNINFDFEF